MCNYPPELVEMVCRLSHDDENRSEFDADGFRIDYDGTDRYDDGFTRHE